MPRNVIILSVAAVLVMAAIAFMYQKMVERKLEAEFSNGTLTDITENVTLHEVEPTIPVVESLVETSQHIHNSEPTDTTVPTAPVVKEFNTEEEFCCEEELEVAENSDTVSLSWAELRTQELIAVHGDIPEVHTFVRLYSKLKRRETFTPHEYLELLRATEVVQPYAENAGAADRFKAFIERNGVENVSMTYRKRGEEFPQEREELVWDESYK